MALDITAQDIICDETTGLQDSDVDPTALPYSSNTTLQYLLTLDAAGGLSSPQVAYRSNFVVASADAGETIASIVLAQNASGTPFSTTVGVNSYLRTVDGNYIWLFQDASHANVIIGVIGTSDPLAEPADPDGTDQLAFSIGLVATDASHADLYTVEYVPLMHPTATNPDDRIDLANAIFASVSASTTANFSGQNAAPGNHDFYVINSLNDAAKQILVTGFLGTANATANVSTQGFGVNNQSINPTESLQVDFVTGGDLAAGSAAQIQYDNHLESITQAGFTVNQITPSNPNLRVDITITALNVQGDEQGLNFWDGSSTTAAPITSIRLTGQSGYPSVITANGSYNVAGNVDVEVSGMGTNAVTIRGLDNVTTVNITTSSAMDRLVVTGVDSNEGLDITEFHFSTTTPNPYAEEVGSFINFDDDGPSMTASATAVPTMTNDDTDILDSAGPTSFASLFTSAFGADGFKDADNNDVQDADAITYVLGVKDDGSDVASGLSDTLTGGAVVLNKVGNDIVGTVSGSGEEVFRISISAAGAVTFTQSRAVVHDNPNDPVESGSSAAGLSAPDLVTLTATIIDGDGDSASATRSIGGAFKFEDDGPTLTVAFDADPATLGNQSPEQLDNVANATASGAFGYDIGADAHLAAYYTGGGSDFVDADSGTPGVQISLTGTVDNASNPGITNAVATLVSESLTSATFNFSFGYDKDPVTAGVQAGTAGGTLVFDKAADTYTFTLTDVIDGFSFSVLHTNELWAKQPTGNTGHPLIVAEQLSAPGEDPFFVQFTANSVTRSIGFGFNATGDGAAVGDSEFNNGGATHDLITNLHEDWVSATQATNGVAGDTIQKGELLTLRFFAEDILGDVNPGAADGGVEKTNPSGTSDGVVIKFDGIGNSEDLVLILDLIDADGHEITRAINVQNADLIKGNANVPSGYSGEFTLDNNDALLIIEQNDYCDGTETYKIQGVQIMQSSNGLSGMAINLNGGIGVAGDSSTSTADLTAWDATDNDVLKIVDIGFVQQSSGTIDADLVFGFDIADADGDSLGSQQINVHIGDPPAGLTTLSSFDNASLPLTGLSQEVYHNDYFM